LPGFLENVAKGALLIILADPETEYVVWLGRASGDVQNNPDAAASKARLDYAVTKMLKKIPK